MQLGDGVEVHNGFENEGKEEEGPKVLIVKQRENQEDGDVVTVTFDDPPAGEDSKTQTTYRQFQ